MDRRKFIESTCKSCLLASAGFIVSDLAACSPATRLFRLPISENTVRIPVKAFSNEPLQLVRPEGWVYDIAVRKTSTDHFYALLLQCTHQKNQLMPDGSGFTCTLHGSRYNQEGEVKKGPAENSLKKFTVTVEKDQVVIRLA
jgi:Rieske Fe-S protein